MTVPSNNTGIVPVDGLIAALAALGYKPGGGGGSDARYLGVFADLTALQAAYPTANTGDTATVTSPNGNLFWWDGAAWADTGTGYLGDMLKAVYDPGAVSQNAFDSQYHIAHSAEYLLTADVTGVSAPSVIPFTTPVRADSLVTPNGGSDQFTLGKTGKWRVRARLNVVNPYTFLIGGSSEPAGFLQRQVGGAGAFIEVSGFRDDSYLPNSNSGSPAGAKGSLYVENTFQAASGDVIRILADVNAGDAINVLAGSSGLVIEYVGT